MIAMFWILAAVFGLLSLSGIRVYFFGGGWNGKAMMFYFCSIVITAFSIGVIVAGSWANMMIFFTG